jgi:hypothetical protein
MMTRWIPAGLAMCCLCVAVAHAGPYGRPSLPPGFKPHLAPSPGGQVDWGNGYILAEGKGKAEGKSDNDRMMAKRAAETLAARNALAMAVGLQIDADGKFADVRDGEVRIKGVLKGHEIVSEEWNPNATPPEVVVTLRVPVWGAKGVASVVYTDEVRKALGGGKRLTLSTASADVEDAVLVIDARGTKLAPCLFPTVTTPEGAVLYDVGAINEQARGEAPPARYVETTLTYDRLRAAVEDATLREQVALTTHRPVSASFGLPAPSYPILATFALNTTVDPSVSFVLFAPPEAAKQPSRPTSQPASAPTSQSSEGPHRRKVVKASGAVGKTATGIVLTKEDAERLRQDPEAAALLRGGQVMVVVDSVAAGIEGRRDDDDGDADSALALSR